MPLTTASVESSWAPGSGARFFAGLLGLVVVFVLLALVTWRDRVAARAIEDPCDHYLVWVHYRDERLGAHLDASREARSHFCRHVGITESGIANPAANASDGQAGVELRKASWLTDALSAQSLEGTDPIPIVPLDPLVEVGQKTQFSQWYLEVPSGKHALLDTGGIDTVLALPELSGNAHTTLKRSFIRGSSVVQGRYQDVPVPEGNAWFRQVFATEEDIPGLIGVNVFSETARYCMDFEEQLLRFDCDLERPARRIGFVPAYGGGYLVPVEFPRLVPPTFAKLDTGTTVTTILWSGCPIADRVTWTLADPRNDGRPTEIPVEMIHPELLVGGGRVTADRTFVHCIKSWHERPLVLLGMSFLNRFSAIGFDHERREVAFYD